VSPPRELEGGEPDFTEIARRARKEGNVLIQAVVNARGEVTQVEILRPIGLGLDDEAARSVSAWRFEPAKRNGIPVAVLVQVEVSFRFR
jgi:periplasmic protein TonB